MTKSKLKFSILGFIMLLCSIAISQPGILDPSFSGDGKLLLDFGSTGNVGYAVAIQSDGKIVVAGHTLSGTGSIDFAVARLNPDGTLDNSFDFDGKVTTDFNNSTDVPNAIAIQPDGKILVAGFTYFNSYSFALVRYNTDGSLDNSFGIGGLIITSITDDDQARAVAVQEDGRIILAGIAHASGSYSDFVIVRYMPDGSFDNSFGTGGKILTDFLGYHDEAYGVAVQSGGKITVVGTSNDENPASADFAIVRYNSNGSFDSSFGMGGKVRTDFDGGIDVANSVAIQPDGKIVLGGYAHTSSYGYDFALARYNNDGILDNSFNLNGKVTSSFLNDYSDLGYAVVLQEDGKIILAGTAHSGSSVIDFGMVRYNVDGSHDYSFGFLGWVLAAFGESSDECFSVALQPDKKIVLAGFSEDAGDSNFALARFLSGLETGVLNFAETQNQLLVYPNPISESSTLNFSLLKDEVISIELYDLKGVLVQTFYAYKNFPEGINEIELVFNSTMTEGYYNLVLRNDDGCPQSIRILKQ
jgi:uncharacterized delta-60 repeat protein